MIKKILTALTLFIAVTCQAFTPPNIVNVTIGFAPGSGNELSFRKIAAIVERSNPDLRFVINNRPGADQIIALDYFGSLKPRGDQLYILSQNTPPIIENWYPGRLKFDLNDLALVTNIAKSPNCIVATATSTVNSPQELLARIKNTKTALTFGLGSSGQKLMFEYMMDQAQGNADLVKSTTYKGPAQALQDLAAGVIEFAIVPSAIAAPLAEAGKIKFIALTSEQKLARLSAVPLMKDYVRNFNYYSAWAIALPVGSSQEQIKYYQDLFVPVIRSVEAREFFDINMMLTFPEEHTPEGLQKSMAADKKIWLPYIIKFKPE
jgi:tripartite-type tricarboxylate transporter receptor subunit TctC